MSYDIYDMLIYVLYIWEMWVCAQSLSCVQPFVTPWTVALAGLLCPCDSPGKNTRVGCHALIQGIFHTQGSNPRLLHCS